MMLDYSESPLKRRVKAVFTKPHQPFFLLGIFIAVYSMGVFAFVIDGGLQINSLFFHAFNMSILMTTPLFLGFLFTVLYRFLLVMPFLQKDYMRVFWTLLGATLLCEIGFFGVDAFVFIGISLAFAAKLMAFFMFIRAYKKSNVDDKREIFVILSAFAIGGVADVFFAASIFAPSLLDFAVSLAFYAYSVGLAFAVAQKMVPNFFILYFGVSAPAFKSRTPLYGVQVSLFLIAISRGFDITHLFAAANFIGLVCTALVFWQNKFVFRRAPAVLWVLQVAALWFIAAFVAGFAFGVLESFGVVSAPYAFSAHMFGVGFIAVIIIGFGSRVSLGHSGRKIEADRETKVLFLGFCILAFLRLAGVFSYTALEISVYAWLFLFAAWAFKYVPLLTSD